MGGKKKLTLKQMERMTEKQAPPKKESKSSGGGTPEKKVAGITPPDIKSEKVISDLKKLKVLTPYIVASRFELRLSIARDMLEELQQKGVIQFVSGSRNTKIYKPAN
jgi:small subunit ribosomal protein S25e